MERSLRLSLDGRCPAGTVGGVVRGRVAAIQWRAYERRLARRVVRGPTLIRIGELDLPDVVELAVVSGRRRQGF